MGVSNSDMGDLVAQLLQSIQDLEKQREQDAIRLRESWGQLQKERKQLEKDQQALLEEKGRLVVFQSFIAKLAGQIQEFGQSNQIDNKPLPKRKTGS